jgi:hypothetical protein
VHRRLVLARSMRCEAMLQPCRGHAISVGMENNGIDSAAIGSRQRAHRSAVSNGTKLFCVDNLDGRSQTARRFRDLVEGMGNDLGGSDRLSEGQRQLIRRAATLSIMSESVEADFIRNLAFDSEAYGVLCDRLGRCLQRLGLERVARPVNDESQALADYFSRPPPKEGAAP